MKYYMENMKKALDSETCERLKSIWRPTPVAVPPGNPCRNLVAMPDGEIRIYGTEGANEPDDIGRMTYISSRDAGLTWHRGRVSGTKSLSSAGYNPKSGRWISTSPNEKRFGEWALTEGEGSFACLSEEGPDSSDIRFVKLADERMHILKNPMYFDEYDRWIIQAEFREKNGEKFVHLFISDDDGESWKHLKIPHAPIHKPKFPHLGVRWQEYSCEPTIADLGGGHLMMLLRTSQDFHYIQESFDRGDTWTSPVPSQLHGTITMPVLYKLSDGRIVLFWCNTEPMPELDHESAEPSLDSSEKQGIWEDVFTNRDVNHLAISEDGGLTWRGMRELYLNPLRNNADFRSVGGRDERDKSVHQAEILELPFEKLLVACGQNAAVRRVFILDIGWLYETERRENFRDGFAELSTHMYVKSVLGCYRGYSGHCAYNRTNGALLVPDPDMNYEEAMLVRRLDDELLVYKKQGGVWNFPASQHGKVAVRYMTLGKSVRLSLLDRWVNPSAEYAKDSSFASVVLDFGERGAWHDAEIIFDTRKKSAELYIDGVMVKSLPVLCDAPLGLSYLHIQSSAEKEDRRGTYIKKMEKTDI